MCADSGSDQLVFVRVLFVQHSAEDLNKGQKVVCVLGMSNKAMSGNAHVFIRQQHILFVTGDAVGIIGIFYIAREHHQSTSFIQYSSRAHSYPNPN